jgi:valyl-tRNA synthetase
VVSEIALITRNPFTLKILLMAVKTLINPEVEEQFALIIGVVRVLRNLRAEAEIKPGARVTAILQSENEQECQILESGRAYIQDLAKVEALTIVPSLDREYKQAFAGVEGTVQVLLPLSGLVDIAALRAKLEKKLSKVEGDVKLLSGRLNNPKFVEKAPAEVVQGARDALAEAEKQAEILRDRAQRLTADES